MNTGYEEEPLKPYIDPHMDLNDHGRIRTCIGTWMYVYWNMDVRVLEHGCVCIGTWMCVYWNIDVCVLEHGCMCIGTWTLFLACC